MQTVSREYTESMKSPLRNRGFIRVSMGLTNKDAQENAYITQPQQLYFSNSSKIFRGNRNKIEYVTMERDFAKVDGSMYIPPKPNESYGGMTSSFVSESLAPCDIRIDFIGTKYDFKGLLVEFGENYPVKFDVTTDTGLVVNVVDNNKSKWTTDTSFVGVSVITLKVYELKVADNRVRIDLMSFGMGLDYNNESVLDSSLTSSVSPISAELPQIDFTVTLKNENGIFDVENPNSIVNFIETGQEVKCEYGYQLPDGVIEWVHGGTFKCTGYKCDNKKLTLNASDILRNQEIEYDTGDCNTNNPLSYSRLAQYVLYSMGITDYYIDPSLNDLTTSNPIPRVKSKEALQMIANACMCTLSVNRDGRVEFIKHVTSSTNIVDFEITKSDMTCYPTTIKAESVRDVIVSYYEYTPTQEVEVLLTETLNLTGGNSMMYYFTEPHYEYVVSGVTGYAIYKQGAFCLGLTYNTPGTYNLEIKAKKFRKIEKQVSVSVSDKGKVIRWSNPLVDNERHALMLGQWLADYYRSRIEYEYDTRGNPELDTMDMIAQENTYIPNMRVCVTRHVINFRQSFSGKLVTRRLN